MQACFDETGVFGILFVDGLSMLEEKVAAWLFSAFEDIPIVGGSAGDDLRFERTGVYADGRLKEIRSASPCSTCRCRTWTARP